MSLSEHHRRHHHRSASQTSPLPPPPPPPRRSLDAHPAAMGGQPALVPSAAMRHEHHQHARPSRRDPSSVPARIYVPSRRQNYRDHPASLPPPTPSSYSSMLSPTRKSASSDMIELVFTKLLDALIFTSAIAITAYNYWTGSLNNGRQSTITAGPSSIASSSSSSTPRTPLSPMTPQFSPTDIRWRQQYPPYKLHEDNEHHHHKRHASSPGSPLEGSRRKRTLQWAETVAHQQQQPAHHPSKERMDPDDGDNNDDASSSTSTIRVNAQQKKRALSLPPPPAPGHLHEHRAQAAREKQDQMFARMEERLQSLIEEGQAALSSRVDANEHLDESDIALRRAFSARKKYSL